MQNPLFYNQVVALDSVAHRELKFSTPDQPLAFAQGANLIPALTDEFVAAAPHLPIAFLPGATQPAAVFVTGSKPGSNVFVGDDGRWTAGYVPAYLRRYPFIMGDMVEGEPILCVDESYSGLSTDKGEPLFTESGEASQSLQQALALADNYRTAAARSDAFCLTLQKLGLLRPVTLDVKLAEGGSNTVHGLMILDEEAFDALGADQLAELHRDKLLKPIMAHLVSLAAIDKLSVSPAR